MSEEVMKNIALEVVREKLLHYVHQVSQISSNLITIYCLSFEHNWFFLFQEIPYGIDHRLVDWKELRNGSLRIEQHLIAPKKSQVKILVGKKGSKIG